MVSPGSGSLCVMVAKSPGLILEVGERPDGQNLVFSSTETESTRGD